MSAAPAKDLTDGAAHPETFRETIEPQLASAMQAENYHKLSADATIILLTNKFAQFTVFPMEPQHTTISVRKIPVGLWKRVRLESLAAGKSVSDFVILALTKAIGKKNGEPK